MKKNEYIYDIIAIDGPSGAGKTTIARLLASELNWKYLDTGAMYRAITWDLMEQNILEQVKIDSSIVKKYLCMNIKCENDFVFVNGRDVSEAIRSKEVTSEVSYISSLQEVRNYLVMQQRIIAKGDKYVMEGRDIGTNVFPDAKYKFFLTADPKERAKRRWLQNGQTRDIQIIYEEIVKRDEYDSSRALNPLKKAEDAMEIDTTNMSINEVVMTIKNRITDNGILKECNED